MNVLSYRKLTFNIVRLRSVEISVNSTSTNTKANSLERITLDDTANGNLNADSSDQETIYKSVCCCNNKNEQLGEETSSNKAVQNGDSKDPTKEISNLNDKRTKNRSLSWQNGDLSSNKKNLEPYKKCRSNVSVSAKNNDMFNNQSQKNKKYAVVTLIMITVSYVLCNVFMIPPIIDQLDWLGTSTFYQGIDLQ
eukprot:TCONS_00063766-protein